MGSISGSKLMIKWLERSHCNFFQSLHLWDEKKIRKFLFSGRCYKDLFNLPSWQPSDSHTQENLKIPSRESLDSLTFIPHIQPWILALCRPAESLQPCLTLYSPVDCSPPGSPVHAILQTRILECVAMPSSWASSWSGDWTNISHVSSIGRRVLYHILSANWEALQLLLLMLSRFSRVRFCVTPETAAHEAPPSLGFSRQEHWSGLPFPPPMHESEKWKWSHSVVSDTQQPHGLQPTRLLHPWDFPGKSTGVGCHCLPY